MIFEDLDTDPSGPRIVLYAHDTYGLGHSRRTSLIAGALRERHPTAAILLISGSAWARRDSHQPGIDHLTLPSIVKQPSGSYRGKSLPIGVAAVVSLRSSVIEAALAAFDPDLFIVDNVPRGVMGELDASLERLHRRGRTRCVLGIRDVLDEPDRIREEWRLRRNHEAIDAFYDRVWVYGDKRVHDLGREYAWPTSTLAKTEYVGYLDPTRRTRHGSVEGGNLILGMVGGGGDGEALARAFVDPEADVPWGERVLLTGPHLPMRLRSELAAVAHGQPRLSLVDHHDEPEAFLARAARVVTMGGYNSTMEVVAFGIPALVVPRVTPRREQWLRAEAFARLGLVEVALPHTVSGRSIRAWLERDVPRKEARALIDFGGLERVSEAAEAFWAPRITPLDGEDVGAGRAVG